MSASEARSNPDIRLDQLTDCIGLDLDTFFKMSVVGII